MTQDTEGFLARWSRRKAQAREEPASSASVGKPADVASAARPEDSAASVKPVEAARPPRPEAASQIAQATDSTTPAATGREPAATATTVPPPDSSTSRTLPTLQDVSQLTRESDYAPFVAREVDPSVRNAALRKLFTDPHFNVMDGLDIYIDDYGKPDPLPAGMLRQMVQSRALGLFDEPKEMRKADGHGSTSEHLGEIDDIDENSRGARPLQRNQDGLEDGPDGAGENPAAAPTEPLTAESRTLPAERQPDEDPDLRLQPHRPAEVGRGDGDPDAGAAAHAGGKPRGA